MKSMRAKQPREGRFMGRFMVVSLVISFLFSWAEFSPAQQKYLLPDVRSMKQLTTSKSDHAVDIPGKETVMDFYSAPNGQLITVYSYKGRSVAFSTHSNSDIQNTYRIFMDLTGDGLFTEVNKSVSWQLPGWAR